MTSVEVLLAEYRSTPSDEIRAAILSRLLERAPSEAEAVDALLYVLNEENNSRARLTIVKYLEWARPNVAVHALAKEMFDPDPLIRAHAAAALAGYADVRLLGHSLAALLDALPDPATRAPAEKMIRALTGRAPEQITVTERHRIRLGEHPRTLWPEHFSSLSPP